MLLSSRFRFWALLPIGLLLGVTGLLALLVYTLVNRPANPPFGVFVYLALFGFTWLWLVFGELRTKVIKVQIQEGEIIVSNYFGLGSKKKFYLSQLDGLETVLLPSKYNTYEYLYLIENGKKAIKLSQFYHKNYNDLKNSLTRQVQNFGQKDFSFIQELKEIFI
jgi:hypothetical protein